MVFTENMAWLSKNSNVVAVGEPCIHRSSGKTVNLFVLLYLFA